MKVKKGRTNEEETFLGAVHKRLQMGFNVLIRGRGSKLQMLKGLRKLMKEDKVDVVFVYGHLPETRPVTILKEVADKLNRAMKFSKGTLLDDAEHMAKTLNKDVCLVIYNLNGESLRDSLTLELLATLASHNEKHRFSLVATLYGENGDVYWDPKLKRQLKFFEYVVNTNRYNLEELSAFNRKLVAGSDGKSQNLHTEESLAQIWDSLPETMRRVFKQMYVLVQESDTHAIAFDQLYHGLRNSLVVNSESILENHMKELRSHCLVSMNDERMVKFDVELCVLGTFMDDKLDA